ncbi:MAG: RNA polymerase sigma factor [Thermodesulfobacteriota bacterium]
MEPSDEQIVHQVLTGRKSQYELLVIRYQRQIYNLMYRHCQSADDAAELTQELFCKVYEKLDLYDNGRSFFSWLYTISMNHARDWSRKQQRRVFNSDQLEERATPPEQQPDSRAEHRQQLDLMVESMEALSTENRELLILRYTYSTPLKELAGLFDLSLSGVKMRLQRSLAALQVRMGELEDGRHRNDDQ